MTKNGNAAVVVESSKTATTSSGTGKDVAGNAVAGADSTTKAQGEQMPKGYRSRTYGQGSALWNLAYLEAWQAVEWAKTHPEAWAWATSRIVTEARANRNPNVQATFKQLRFLALRGEDGWPLPFTPVKFKNDYCPAWARIIEAGLEQRGEYLAASRLRRHMKASWFDSEGMPWADSLPGVLLP